MEQQSSRVLAEEKVGRLMRRFAVPCVISLLVGALYNIVDQIFIGWGVGAEGNAATTVVFPLTVVALAVAVMIGDGACAFVSLSLGARETERAHRSVGSAVTLSVLAGAALTAVYLLFAPTLLTVFGAGKGTQIYAYAEEYFFTITLGIPLYLFGQAVNPIIRSDGAPRFAMAATLSGAILNVILDPVAIFVLHWGMMGAAAATVAGQLVTAVLSAWYLARMKTMRLTRRSFRLSLPLLGRFLPLGICSFLSQISMVLAMAATNNMLRVYGAADPVYGLAENSSIPLAVLGIVMKVFQIVISVVVGMAAGCIPIVGYNIGAGRNDRARGVFLRLLAAEAAVGAAALAAVECFPGQLIAVFGTGSPLYEAFAVRTFRIYLCMLLPACVNKAAFIFLQSLGKPWLSTGLSFLREVALGVPLVLLLPRLFGLDGILYSMPLADALTFGVSAVVLAQTWRELGGGSPRELLRVPARVKKIPARSE